MPEMLLDAVTIFVCDRRACDRTRTLPLDEWRDDDTIPLGWVRVSVTWVMSELDGGAVGEHEGGTFCSFACAAADMVPRLQGRVLMEQARG